MKKTEKIILFEKIATYKIMFREQGITVNLFWIAIILGIIGNLLISSLIEFFNHAQKIGVYKYSDEAYLYIYGIFIALGCVMIFKAYELKKVLIENGNRVIAELDQTEIQIRNQK